MVGYTLRMLRPCADLGLSSMKPSPWILQLQHVFQARAGAVLTKPADYYQNKDTFWATEDGDTTATLTVKWEQQKKVSYIVLQEPIWLGQRVKSFKVEANTDRGWVEVAAGTTIGYKRILKIDPLMTSQLRIAILDSKECVALSSVKIY